MSEERLSSVSYSLIQPRKKRWLNIHISLAVVIIILVTWSAYAHIDVMVFATGQVTPVSSLKTVQHFEGGIVEDIFVKKGDRVSAGDPLVKVVNINISTQLNETQTRLRGVEAALNRLEAEINDHELVFDKEFAKNWPNIVADERQLFDEHKSAQEEQIKLYGERLRKNEQEQEELSKQLALAGDSISTMNEELMLTEELYKEGAVSKVEILRLQRQMNGLKQDKQRFTEVRLSKQSEERRIQQELGGYKTNFIKESIKQRNGLENQKSELMEIIIGMTDKTERSLVVSPVDGVVNQVLVSTVGGVVKSGMDLVEIVPNDDNLLIKAKIKPEDIALLNMDQQANVKLTAYDFAIYGSLTGFVDYIGADTLEERNGEQYYVANIRINNALFLDDRRYPILPGMLANIGIITNKRTVLSYITKPIARVRQRALRED